MLTVMAATKPAVRFETGTDVKPRQQALLRHGMELSRLMRC